MLKFLGEGVGELRSFSRDEEVQAKNELKKKLYVVCSI